MKFSSLSRIYTTSRIAKNQIITLSDDIFHYCKSVLRMKISEEFRLFNSIDGEFKAKIRTINKRDLQVVIGQKLREVKYQKPLILAMCIIKPDRFTEALKAAVQHGVTEIIPVISERTQFKNINQQRLTRCMIESVEQSEGFVVPVLHLPMNLKELYNNISGVDQIIFANEEESGGVKISSIKKIEENIAILVGPEGGFSPTEKEKLLSSPKVISVSLAITPAFKY